MFDYDKYLTAKAFLIRRDQNIKSNIFIITYPYYMRIDNPNIKLNDLEKFIHIFGY